MSVCRIVSVNVSQTPLPVEEDLSFDITLDVAEPLSQDVVLRCVYIFDASDPARDVELDCIDVGEGGLPRGLMRFKFDSPAPSRESLRELVLEPEADADVENDDGAPRAFAVGGLYLSALYRDQEFCRVGYYIRLEYEDPALQSSPPADVDWSRLRRVLSEPQVTLKPITWDPAPLASWDQEGDGNLRAIPVPMSSLPKTPSDEQGAAKKPRLAGS